MNLDDLQDASLDDPRFESRAKPDPAAGGVMSVPEGVPGPSPGRFVPDGVFHRLEEGYVPAARIAGWIATACVMVVIPVGIASFSFVKGVRWPVVLLMGSVGALVIGASIFGAHVWPVFELRHTRWRVDTDGLEIRRGVVWRHTISVPRERVQHTDVAQGPIQRRFGLATLSVHTAGTHHSEVQLSGLSYETAQAVRNDLLEEAKDSGDRKAVGEAPSAGEERVPLPPMSEASLESPEFHGGYRGADAEADECRADEAEDDHERA